MRRRENLRSLFGAATVLSVAILITFQVYQWREPARLEADAAADRQAAVDAGREIYAQQCAVCHGPQGEGIDAPALNSKALLSSTQDEQLFSIIRSGVPGTAMPAWSQAFGGPLTDEQIRQVVAFLRSWEATAPEAPAARRQPDPARGAEIFASTCFACHGPNGEGTDRAPALNDPDLLNRFDDEWFRETIREGRPSRGMPTWGTVLSPEEIDDVVALLAAWRRGETVTPPPPEGDLVHLGEHLFAETCAACHGPQGEGAVGPSLHNNPFVSAASDEELLALLQRGRPGTAMPAFEGRYTDEEFQALIALLRSWQP